ncbi:DoxX family protein [soil metagenome]
MKFFPFKPDTTLNITALLLRLTSALMISHGWKKLASFSEKADSFPDPLHVGHTLSLSLTIFAEFFCSILIVSGLFTRLATIPLIICMLVIIFIVDKGQPYLESESAIFYCLLYFAILVIGSGKYSLDNAIRKTY